MITAGLLGALKEAVPAVAMEAISGHVEEVERELRDQVESPVATVRDAGEATLTAGGKRLRPALVAASALATGLTFDKARAARIGASLEMVHMATLIHDDVIDEAPTRRGYPTAASLHGNTAAILSGDVLLARAMRLLALDGDLRVIRAVSEAVVDLAEGEVCELDVRGDFDLSESEHRRILEKKTAALISCSCRVGAMIGGAPLGVETALGTYGRHLGMAFQIVDDVLDYRGDRGKTGKPWATDFREGQATLPLIYLRETLAEEEARFAEVRFGNGVVDEELNEICAWMEDRGTFARAQRAAEEEGRLAVRSLDVLPETPYRDLLAGVVGFVNEREA